MITLCDASPLVALINRKDKNHKRSIAALATITDSLLTTWPCLAEAMHLLGSYGGWPTQKDLWGYLEDGLIGIHLNGDAERQRMFALMQKYKDTPMDLADASIVAAVEVLNTRRVFTFDTDFYVYQIWDNTSFEVIP